MYTQVDRPKVDPLLALDLRGNEEVTDLRGFSRRSG